MPLSVAFSERQKRFTRTDKGTKFRRTKVITMARIQTTKKGSLAHETYSRRSRAQKIKVHVGRRLLDLKFQKKLVELVRRREGVVGRRWLDLWRGGGLYCAHCAVHCTATDNTYNTPSSSEQLQSWAGGGGTGGGTALKLYSYVIPSKFSSLQSLNVNWEWWGWYL